MARVAIYSTLLWHLLLVYVTSNEIAPLDEDNRIELFDPDDFRGGYTTKEGEEIPPTLAGEKFTERWAAEDSKSSNAPIPPGTTLPSIHGWTFLKDEEQIHNIFPVQLSTINKVQRHVPDVLYSKVNMTAFETEVKLAAYSNDVIENYLQMDSSIATTKEFLHIFSGNGILENTQPLAHRYGGHQFGIWAEQLGDGRAHTLGEVLDKNEMRWEVQLKGSGKTPYSRDGDGRAVIRSSVREFLASEAMHRLGIPTSRAGSLIVSDDQVRRDQFYNGNLKMERTAVVMRLARSWLRFGTIELMSKNGEFSLLRETLDKIILRFFPQIDIEDSDRYLELFSQIIDSTAEMIALWMSVGFAHGVMNTDNFSVHGITIDYGPFRFLDEYKPDMVPNTSDDEKRYAFGKQPDVAYQNLAYLLKALTPVLDQGQQKQAQVLLMGYHETYKILFKEEILYKLGLHDVPSREEDDELIEVLFRMMAEERGDFTMTFRELSEWSIHDMRSTPIHIPSQFWALKKLSTNMAFEHFVKELYVPRVLEHVQPRGDADRERLDDFRSLNPDWSDASRMAHMQSVNPRYVLRNWMAEKVIRAAEEDDFQPLWEVYHVLQLPYTTHAAAEREGYASEPPLWARGIKVSCSS